MNKTIFIDIDGTLCDSSGNIRPLTEKAIIKAKEKGHKLFLCSGRSISEIVPKILELNFDGIIGAGGSYIEYNHEVLYHKVITKESLLEVVYFFQTNKIEYYLECNSGIYASENCISKMIEIATTMKEQPMDSSWFFDLLKPIPYEYLDTLEVNKFCFINTVLPMEYFKKRFSDTFDVVAATVIAYGEKSGEITSKGVDKQSAIRFLCEYLNINKEDTIAIGDGENDIPMFKSVNYSIAMGNAAKNLKMIADEVCEDIYDDGFYYSFLKNKLI